MAFLALDRNGNGRIDTGAELFGNATVLGSGRRARHGFEALQELDENDDGLLNTHDSVWDTLLFWRDKNHDGQTAANELLSVSATDVEWIGVEDVATLNRRDEWGNIFRYSSRVGMRGKGPAETRRLFFDVLLTKTDN